MFCSICGGALALLGYLGNLAHLRCVQCGSQCSVAADQLETGDEFDYDDCLA